MFGKKISKIRTRFAPSPTGWLHIGGLRTALYSYLFAKQNKGDFILRIEDTDQERLVPKAKENISNMLKTFGLIYDEGFDVQGKFGPYIQSERLDLYKQYVQKLLDNKKAYYCFCTSERLDQLRHDLQSKKLPPKYDRHCCKLTDEEVKQKLASNQSRVVRLKVPDGETKFNDLIRGEIIFQNKTIDDQILLKSDGYPTYHLAVVVDDNAMKISHVIRGEEWIPSTPKHIMLYQAFNWQLPHFAHLPLLLNPDKSKLSKRQGDVAVEDYLKKGYSKQALINFIALLGWNPGDNREIFSLADLKKEFKLSKVQKSGAVFNIDKLNWLSNKYIKNTKTSELLEYFKDLEFSKDLKLEKILDLFKDRLEYLQQIPKLSEFLYHLPDYQPDILIFKKSTKEKTIQALNISLDYLLNYKKEWTAEDLKNNLDIFREQNNLTRAEMFWPLRVAVTGMDKSPDVFDVMSVLPKTEVINRLKIAIEKLSKI